MSRRSGQRGHIEKSGRWWVVRVWVDIPGQDKKAHPGFPICPAEGPGALNKSQRRLRADEILIEKGINSSKKIAAVIDPTTPVTFAEQAEVMLEEMRSRLRDPAAETTLYNYEIALRLHLNPVLGGYPLSEIYNPELKLVVRELAKKGCATSSIVKYITIAKEVVGSAIHPRTGEALYPRKWKAKLIDLPIIDANKQNTPDFSRKILNALAAYHEPRLRMLFILAGATGARIAELLGLEIDQHISPDFRTLYIRQQARKGKIVNRVKKRASYREVDLHPDIAAVLKAFIGDRKSGFLFVTRKNKPVYYEFVLRHLHRSLKAIGYINDMAKSKLAGAHAFRRFRDTYLRNETLCPEGIYKFWLGHALGQDMSELYDKIKRDRKKRLEWAERCGYGFDLPSIVLAVPKEGGILAAA